MKKISVNSVFTLAIVLSLGLFGAACSSKKDQVKADENLASSLDSSGTRFAQADSANLGAGSSGRGN